MAIYYARANGNVNATNVWSTTASGTAGDYFGSFTNSDILMSNSFTVTINVNTTVGQVRNDTNGGATAGGSFAISSGITLTADIYAGAANCVTHATGNVNIIGNIYGGSSSGANGVYSTSSGTLNITGSITGGSNAVAYGVSLSSTGAVNITGNIFGSTGRGVGGSSGPINIIGNITGGTASNGSGYRQDSNISSTVIGTVTGGTVEVGLYVAAGSITVTGTAIGGAAAGVYHISTGTVSVIRAKGGAMASSNVGVIGSSIGFTRVEEIEYGDLGASPVSGRIILTDKTSNVAIMYRFGTTKKTLTDASATVGLLPSTSDVRRNVVYNGGNNVGTMDVPAAASVALGVSVDNTTGTAILTSGNIGDIWNYPVSGISVSNSIGERLKNCSTVATMGQQLAAALNNVQ